MGSHLPRIFLSVSIVKSMTEFSLNLLVLPKYSEKLRSTANTTVAPQLTSKHSITYNPSLVLYEQ
jgi:hypothetical protein